MINNLSFIHGSRIVFGLLLIWTLIWKGIALWKAAQKGEKIWYIVLLVLNTAGILEILYIYVFSKRSAKHMEAPATTVPPMQQ